MKTLSNNKYKFPATLVVFIMLCVICIVPAHFVFASTINIPSNYLLTSGLVGYWTFDGKNMNWATNKALDTSGQGNDGTLVNMSTTTSPTIGKIGQAFKFDGMDDYISIPDSNSLDLTDHFTISMWFKPTALNQTNRYLLSKRGPVDNSYAIIWEYSNNTIEFYSDNYTGTNPRTGTSISISDTQWHNILYTYNGSTWSGYVDGVNVFSISRTFSLIASTGDLLLNDYNGGGNWDTNGMLDDIRIYDRALSATEIRSLYNMGVVKQAVSSTNALTSGLVGYWTFDGKNMNWATNKALDTSGQGNDGTLVNMSTTTSPVPGKTGQGLNFDGVDDYINMGSVVGDLTESNDLTVSLWFKPAVAMGELDGLISKSATNPWSFGIRYLSGSLELYTTNSSVLSASYVPAVGQWQQVIVTTSSTGSRKIYVNGVLKNSDSASLPYYTANSDNLYIGLDFQPGQGHEFNGSIDDVRIYNRALSTGEVSQLYRNGR